MLRNNEKKRKREILSILVGIVGGNVASKMKKGTNGSSLFDRRPAVSSRVLSTWLVDIIEAKERGEKPSKIVDETYVITKIA